MIPTVEDLSPRRRRTRERRAATIVDAALSILAAESVEALTMAKLGRAVDLTPGALYRYFPSKSALMAALEAHAIHRIATGLRDARAKWRSDLPEPAHQASLCELVAAAAFYRRLATDDPRVFRLVSATLGDPRPLVEDEHATTVSGPLSALLLEVTSLFEAAQSSGALSTGRPGRRTVVFWVSLHGVASVAKLDRLTRSPGLFAPEHLWDELTKSLLIGWGARPAEVEQAHAWQRERDSTA